MRLSNSKSCAKKKAAITATALAVNGGIMERKMECMSSKRLFMHRILFSGMDYLYNLTETFSCQLLKLKVAPVDWHIQRKGRPHTASIHKEINETNKRSKPKQLFSLPYL